MSVWTLTELAGEAKHRRYDVICAQAGWTFIPMVFTSFARPGSECRRAVDQLIRAAARRLGDPGDPTGAMAVWRNVGTAIMARNAAMMEACMPRDGGPRLAEALAEAWWEGDGSGGGVEWGGEGPAAVPAGGAPPPC